MSIKKNLEIKKSNNLTFKPKFVPGDNMQGNTISDDTSTKKNSNLKILDSFET